MECIKKNYLKAISDGLPTDYSTPTIEIDTSVLKKWYGKGVCDTKGDHTMFGKIFKKLKEKNFENMRIQASTNYGWYANFTNEGTSNDGSYRRHFSWMMDELHSSFLPLFIPSKNNKEKNGPFQDRWVINPACNSTLHLDMYKFIGGLIALAFRSGHVMDFRLTPLFWKKFLCDPLKLKDLESIDEKLYISLKNLKEKDSSENSIQKLNFTTELSDGTLIPLVENGEDEYITQENQNKYVDLVLSKRFEENNAQMESIKKGFDTVFPSEVARVLSWQNVEERVRGDDVDIDKLKSITDYSDISENDEYGTRFWNILTSFTQEERSRYLRCVGGRTRLPPQPRLSEVRHRVYCRDESYYSNHDENEISVSTDSFNIYLNRFSTEEIMKAKIWKAIEKSERYYHYGAEVEGDQESKNIGSVNSGSDSSSEEEEGSETDEDSFETSSSSEEMNIQRNNSNESAS